MKKETIKAGDLCVITKGIITTINNITTEAKEESFVLVVSTKKYSNMFTSNGLTINYFNNSGSIKSISSEYIKKVN